MTAPGPRTGEIIGIAQKMLIASRPTEVAGQRLDQVGQPVADAGVVDDADRARR